MEEDEFFDLETFSSGGVLLAKTHAYQLYFNLVGRNAHKENQSSWQITQRLAPRSPPDLCLLPAVLVDHCLNESGGYDMPRFPSNRRQEAGVTTCQGAGKMPALRHGGATT